VRLDAKDAVEALLGVAGVDELLRLAHHRLVNCVRTTDIVAIGDGGIFLIVANDLQSDEELEIVSDRIQRTCLGPYVIQDREIVSGLTTGAAGTEGGSAASELIERAVSAMNLAAGRGVAFELSRSESSNALPAFTGPSPAGLREPFALTFVPQFSADVSLTGARVLPNIPKARPRRRAKNTSARSTEMRERVGDQVLRLVLEQARSWRDKGLAVPVISVDVGTAQLLNAGFADALLSLLQETNSQGSSIELLLTEATALTSLARAAHTIKVLEEVGVRFGLCGFSVNAGSRLNLRELPFTSLRVSCGSLFKVTSAAESLWVARSIVAVAHKCGLQFVGEDVETEAQKSILRESGCDRFEGPLFSAALQSSDLEAQLIRK